MTATRDRTKSLASTSAHFTSVVCSLHLIRNATCAVRNGEHLFSPSFNKPLSGNG